MIDTTQNPISYSSSLNNFLTLDTINDKTVITPNNIDQILSDNVLSSAKFQKLSAGSLDISTTGYIRSGKTSLSDSANSGFYFDSGGMYIGSAADSTYLKFTTSDGAFGFKGKISGLATDTIASAISTDGNFVKDVINSKFDTASKAFLSGFVFSGYAGAIKTGDVAWNTSTGAITGGSGVLLSNKGLLGVNNGNTTFLIDATTGAATFAGALSAPTGTLGSITVGTSGSIKSGKTSLSDSTNPGWYIGYDGFYFGRASDNAYIKYRISDGAFTMCGRGVDIIAGAINASGNFVNQLINSNFDTSAKRILSGFTFGDSGAIQMITDSDNGLWISSGGLLGKNGGVTTFSIDTSGNATFRGSITSSSITGGTITGGVIQTSSSSTDGIKINDTSNTMDAWGNSSIRFHDSGVGGYYGYIGATSSGISLVCSDSNRKLTIGSYQDIILDAASYFSVYPGTNGTVDLGNSSYQWRNVYIQQSGTTTPLHVGSYSFRPVGFSYTYNGVNHSITVLATGDPV